MNDEAMNAVDALTKPWTDVLTPDESGTGKYQPITYPPLLVMLSDAKTSSLGRTSGGRSPDAERSLLNLKAFSLYEHIDGSVRAWWRETSKSRCPEDLAAALIGLLGTLNALHASNQIGADRFGHITAQFPRWRQQIWEMFDPPRVKDFPNVPCPNCGATTYTFGDTHSTALIAFYSRGMEPQAKCQVCGEQWVTDRELLELGYRIGATVDVDTLRDMGLSA